MNMPDMTYEMDTRIAVTGVALRVPGAESLDAFWHLLRSGRTALQRFDPADVGHEEAGHPDYVPVHGSIPGIDRFDARLFGTPPREAEGIDPQQRLLLRLAWEALEHGALNPEAFDGRVGVFAGTGSNQYMRSQLLTRPEILDEVDEHTFLLGSEKDFCAGRIAYKLNLTGPALTLQTACSTGLVAVHSAVQHLLGGECDAALAGACSLQVPQEKGYRWREGGILSRSGSCRPFDHLADGTVGGSGGVMLVLKRLGDAVADRDTIYGIIAGSAVNNDGSGKAGFTAPSVGGQVAVMREALLAAGLEASEVDYVEAHGTGTEVGDPIELTALAQVYGAGRGDTDGYCRVGAVKALTGHLDTASGLVGLVKALLALRHGRIPGNPFFEKPNPRFELRGSGLDIHREALPWNAGNRPRRAGVSSLGLGGTNAHLILEEISTAQPAGAEATSHPLLLPLSAESPEALESLQLRVDERLAEGGLSAEDAAFTLQEGRRPLSWRSFRLAGGTGTGPAGWKKARKADRRLEAETTNVLLFPGQGAQYPGMGGELYEALPAFRAEVDRLCAMADPLMEGRCGEFFRKRRACHTLARSQTCMLVLQLALAGWWRKAGIVPGMVMGHSLGEYAAACVAGVLSEEDALRLVHARGRLIDGLPPGGMMTVLADWDRIRELGAVDLHPAAYNAPGIVTVSGPPPALEEMAEKLDRHSITCIPLEGSRSFHSPDMENIAEPYLTHLRQAEWRRPQLPWLSTATAELVGESGPEYWISQMRNPVRFSEACRQLPELAGPHPNLRFVEAGPGSQLAGLVRRNGLARDRDSLLTNMDSAGETGALLRSLVSAWTQGAQVEWAPARVRDGHRVALPAYPFQEESYWLVAPAGRGAPRTVATASARETIPRGKPACYRPAWERGRALPEAGGPREEQFLITGGTRARAWAAEADGVTFLPLAHTGAILDRLTPGTAGPVPRLLCLFTDADSNRELWHLHLLLQGIRERKFKKPIDVTLITCNAFEVTGEEELFPAGAGAAALCSDAARAFPGLRLTTVDAGRVPSPGLLRALWDEEAGTQIVCRGGYRWHRTFPPAEPAGPGEGTPRLPAPGPGETCLLAGGAGALGLHLAGWLHGRGASLLLLGRRHRDELPTETLREMERLRSEGASLHYLQGDVREPDSLEAARREAEEIHGEVRHIFHLAGTARAGGPDGLTEDEFLDILAVKGQGLENLLDVFGGDALASFTLYSSLASFQGGLAGGAYAAASAAVDARALRRVPHARLKIVNWDGWREIGMGERLAAESGLGTAQLEALRDRALSPGEGRAALDLLARVDGPQLLVAKSPPAPERPAHALNGASHAHSQPSSPAPAAAHARPAVDTPYEEPRDETQRRLAAIWQEALGINRVGIDDNFFDLGADSLLMIRVMEKVNRTLDATLAKTDLFEHTTVRKLAAHLGHGDGATPTADASRLRAARQQEALARQSARAREARNQPNRNEGPPSPKP